MIKEHLQETIKELSINVSQSRIDSIRKKNIQKTAIRIYDQNKIGIASKLGDYSLEELTKKALTALELEIPYTPKPEEKQEVHIKPKKELLSDDEFVAEMKELLSELHHNQPNFTFSHKLTLQHHSLALENDVGLQLSQKISSYQLGLLLNHKDSVNLFDAFVGLQNDIYDKELFIQSTNELCNAFVNPVKSIGEGEYPIVFHTTDMGFYSKLISDLQGQVFASGSSLFSNDLGKQRFHEDFSLYASRSIEDGAFIPCFDMEGRINPEYRFPIIKNGVIQNPYTDKKTAAQFHLTETGCAGGNYDSVPTVSFPFPHIPSTGKTIEELLQGKPGIYISIISGGDFTSEGHFSTPVQLAFFYDGKKLISRLPQISVSSDIFSMYGKDFVGVSTNSFSPLDESRCAVINMHVKQI